MLALGHIRFSGAGAELPMRVHDHPKFLVRLSPDLKAFVAAQAAENASSQNSEIVRAIRERMARLEAEAFSMPRRGRQ